MSSPVAPPAAGAPRAPGTDAWTMLWLAVGVAALALPTTWNLAVGHWMAERHGHEWLVVAASAYLAWCKREALAALPEPPRGQALAAIALLALALAWYVRSHTLQMLTGEMPSQILALAALVMHFKGLAGLRLMAAPLGFLLFAVPPPAGLMIALTAPLKLAVSTVSVGVLKLLGYPVARSGVVITVGQYQLLVAEACAGLQTMFALEAVTLYYGQLVNLDSWRRSLFMAVAAVPIGFVANTARTLVLVLITYHFGDAAGRGFLHGFAGMLLFALALGMAHLLSRQLERLGAWRWTR